MAKTVVVLTVGTNELPCLIAARRLWEVFTAVDGEPPEVWPVYSAEVGGELNRVKEALEGRLGLMVPETLWRPLLVVSAYDPTAIFDKVLEAVRKTQQKKGLGRVDRFHLHYTGGTSAMAVHCIEALRYPERRDYLVETSYLDIQRNRLVSRDWRESPEFYRLLPGDERQRWSMSLEELGRLHGVTVGEPLHPANEVAAEAIAEEYNAHFEGGMGTAKDIQERDRHNHGFEVYVARSLRWALRQVGLSFAVRWNREVFTPGKGGGVRHGIDVACVHGYQLLYMTVTTSTLRGEANTKFMEAWYRAHQIGGSACVVACVAWTDPGKTSALSEDLRFNVGHRKEDFRKIWGIEHVPKLKDELRDFLENELEWKAT